MKVEPAADSEIQEDVTATRKLSWKAWLLIGVISIACLLFVGVVVMRSLSRPPVPIVFPGQLIDSHGTYHAPNPNLKLIIEPTGVPGQSRLYYENAPMVTIDSVEWTFDSSSEWFAAFDDSGSTLWVYADGEIYQTFPWIDRADGYYDVRAHDGWSGIPPSFLKKLPEKHREEYDEWAKKEGLLPAEAEQPSR